MRRNVAVLGVLVLTAGMMWATPASADHCNPASIATCTAPVNVTITEGLGNVCAGSYSAITSAERSFYASIYGAGGQRQAPASVASLPNSSLRAIQSACVFLDGKNGRATDPSWANKAISNWNAAATIPQGLAWVGLGPGAVGPTSLAIGNSVAPGTNVCVSNIGGGGCSVKTVGMLTGGDSLNTAFSGVETGAHCGSSHGRVTIKFTAAGGILVSDGWMEWDQSLATILPLYGRTVGGASQSGQQAQIRGYTSARGVNGSGNCGIDTMTTGFNVEGISITY